MAQLIAANENSNDDDVALTPDGKVDKRYILSGADQEHQSPTTSWVFLVLQPLLWGCCCVAAYIQQKRRSALISTRNTMIQRRRQQRQGGEEEEDFDEDARLELVMTKFHVHLVSAEKTVEQKRMMRKIKRLKLNRKRRRMRHMMMMMENSRFQSDYPPSGSLLTRRNVASA